MSAYGSKMRLCEGELYIHWCPGCKMAHGIDVGVPNRYTGAQWTFNHDPISPTFSPSINIVGQCHYFIREGKIEFCSDSQHKLAGQTVDLPDFFDREAEDYDDLER
jgi:hypothetical protein